MSYIKQRIFLSEHQLAKIRTAAKKNVAIGVDVDPRKPGNFDLYLTKRQVNKLKKGKPVRLNLSPTQLRKNGGFFFTIPAIIAAITAATSIAGATSGIVKAVNEKKAQDASIAEQQRHNQTVENLLKSSKQVSGQGAYLPRRFSKSGKDGFGLKKKIKK